MTSRGTTTLWFESFNDGVGLGCPIEQPCMPEQATKKPLGIYVEHRFRKTNWLYLVMVWKKPYLDPNGKRMSRF